MVLAEFTLYDGEPGLANTELDRYLAVTAADVRRVAAEYFTARNRTIVEAMPAVPANRGGAA
jgi:predicted Zn-dependent peptidase